jgi:hypothetical protein
LRAYPSIETVFDRDTTTHRLNFGAIRAPEVSCVKVWSVSEKIDGTNIRAIVTLDGITVKGRTDKAELPPGLEDAVRAALPSHARLVEFFTEYRSKELPIDWSVTFYGEGYGAGIQKGGDYSATKRFRVFDLMLGEKWTDDADMRSVCFNLDIPVVPFLGWTDSLPDTREGLDELFFGHGSKVAFEDSGKIGVQPEGIVAKPRHVLLDKHGDRVMWKLTYREFGK